MENTDYVKLVVEAKDNKAALEKLLELFNKTIRSHAKKMFFMEQEDAIQELSLALIYAIKTIPKCENSGEVISYLLNAIHFKYCYFCKNYFKKNNMNCTKIWSCLMEFLTSKNSVILKLLLT